MANKVENRTQLLPNWAAIALGHFSLALMALMLWNFRVEDVFPNTEFYLTDNEKKSLLKYGVGFFLIMTLIIHGVAWRLVKIGKDARDEKDLKDISGVSYKKALADLCRSLWPGFFCVIGLFGLITKSPLPLDTYNLTFITGFGLTLGSLTAACLARKWELCPPADLSSPDAHSRKWLYGVIAACVAYAAYFGWLSVLRHDAIHTNLQDFSLYDQLLWNLLHGNGWRCTLWEDNRIFDWNWNAEHFMPSLLLLAPFYAAASGPYVLLIGQAIALGAGALPLYFIAKDKLCAPAPAFFIALAYLLHPIVQQTNIKEFHMDALAPVFLLAAYAFYLRRKWIWYGVALLLALGCKEDVAISVAMFGLFLLLGERDWKAGLATFAAGMLYSVIVIQGVIPHYRDGDPLRQLYRYRCLLPAEQKADPDYMMTMGDLAKAGLLRPHVVLRETATPMRLLSILKLGTPFGFFALIGGWILLWMAPSTATSLLSEWNIQHELQLHYGIAIIPPLAVATVWGAARWCGVLRKVSIEQNESKTNTPVRLSLLELIGRTKVFALLAGLRSTEKNLDFNAINDSKTRARLRGVCVALFVCAALTQNYYGYLPGCDRDQRNKFPLTEHVALAQRYIDALPDDASVSAQVQIGAQVAGRETIHMFPIIHDAEYILLDTRRSPWPMNGADYEQRVRELLQAEEWGVVEPYEDGWLLLKRGHSSELNASALEDLTFKKAD